MSEYSSKFPNVQEVAGMIAALAPTLLSGTVAQRQAVDLTTLTRISFWQETSGPRRLLTFTPGDTVWRTPTGANPDAAPPPPPVDPTEL